MKELLNYRYLLFNLVYKEVKLKYRGSFLGFLWSLLNPLSMIIVYTVAFKYIIRIKMENYAIFLLAGVLPWSFVVNSLNMATSCIIDNGNLIKKVFFPREIIPISTVAFNLVQLILAYIVFVPILAYWKGLSLPLAFLPVLLFLHFLFTLGLSLLLSAVTVYFRDIKHLVEVLLMLAFWVTPIIYPLSMVPERFHTLMWLNPMTVFALAYQKLIYSGQLPGLPSLLIMLCWVIGVYVIGSKTFAWCKPKFAEEV
ncbi:MAG: ABC transporter permease [Deltaproteobacteria bacterium]|nr:ABC transporter permease [Deltaproteobacteria bacterium]MBW2026044.1 ABC transporter permease [Deltaproteobacteria bacterium]MBW2126006.1 ABC transporter permease [Deltaproteobacteria bacterium]